MKLGIAQINTRVWNTDYNENEIISAIWELSSADMIVFPESTIGGYPMNDLLEYEEFVIRQKEIVKQIQAKIKWDLRIVLWFVDYDKNLFHSNWDFRKYNASAVISKNAIKIYRKHLLPNYDVFHEKRWFSPGSDVLIDNVKNNRFGNVKNNRYWVTICEDIWDENYSYNNRPIDKYKPLSLDFILNLSSSPFTLDKAQQRYELIKRHIKNNPTGFLYVNQVGAQDEIIFDGWSMYFDKEWKLLHYSKFFQESLEIIEPTKLKKDLSMQLFELFADKWTNVEKALILWLKDYFEKNNIQKAIIGVSGWIDSAVSLFLLSKVLKKENIYAIYLPSKFSSELSFNLASWLCKNLWIKLDVKNIQKLVDSFVERENIDQITYENVQARIRWNILMMKANQLWWIVINNTNETELILGYGTAYGDLIGAISPLGNLNKQEIYEFAKWINKTYNNVIPQEIITRPASAELSDNQVDPFDYNLLSWLVYDYFFGKIWFQEFANEIWYEQAQKLTNLIKKAEWKRKQAPLVLKLKSRSIWVGRLMPVTR